MLPLLLAFLVDFGIQFTFCLPALIFKTERFYGILSFILDVSGSLTYISCIVVGLLVRQDPSDQVTNTRQIISSVFVLIWASRLGTWLFLRILREGKDSRFDQLKKSRVKFMIPWIAQVVWIFLTGLPVYIVAGNPSKTQPELIWSDYLGICIWIFGFIVEVVADWQKSRFKHEYPNDFVNVGIWKWSRYANYNGEITLWIGMFILCAHGFVENWQWVSILSPLFVTFLITKVSGIPLLEASAEKKYGSRADYKEYKQKTSKFFLWPPKSIKITTE